MILDTTATPATATVPVTQLPDTLPWPAAMPEHGELRGRDRWMDWSLASVKQPDGFDPATGVPITRTTDVVAAPYPEFRAVVRLPRSTAFEDVIGAAQMIASSGDRTAVAGNAQAVLQSSSGSWYITSAGTRESDDHIEPLPVGWDREATVSPRQRDVVAIVGHDTWVNFSDHEL